MVGDGGRLSASVTIECGSSVRRDEESVMKSAVMTTMLLGGILAPPVVVVGAELNELERDFQDVVRPFVETYCAGCHGQEKPEASFDLSSYGSLDSVRAHPGPWELVLERLRAGEMPPEDAEKIPAAASRDRVVDWIEELRRHEATQSAGDPGPVLARRLSNAEYDYSIQDLTGVDIRPTREFPVDPANQAGFDNSGESLTMSPALLDKYLAAARRVADHLVLLPDGLDFAPYPVVVYTERDKFCTQRIVDFYRQQPTDYAGYFRAAWRYRHRTSLGIPQITLAQLAQAEGVSAKYLDVVWAILTDAQDDAGPIAELRAEWNRLPDPDGSSDRIPEACARLGQFVVSTRQQFQIKPGRLPTRGLNQSTQPIILWINRQIAAQRRMGTLPESDGTADTDRLRDAIARFCQVFPDQFYVSERGRMFLPPEQQNKGRLLSAGFHLQFGYFRDDAPLYDLILDEVQQQRLDQLWHELDFVTRAPIRQFSDYVYFERQEGSFLASDDFAFVREDADVMTEAARTRLATLYVAKAVEAGFDERVVHEIDAYFKQISTGIRDLEQEFVAAEASHVQGLLSFAQRAWQRPLTDGECDELLEFYGSLRAQAELTHEDAVRDTLVSVLMSPRFCYRVNLATSTAAAPDGQMPADSTRLSDQALAGRLSYFLWSSIPDAELLEHAEAHDLHLPDVLLAQTRRMLRDGRIGRLATEFGGNWLDFRQFQSHNGVNRDRFPVFTDELRQAMYEEPIHFFADLVQRNGSVLELVEARHTFVNAVLAQHYGIPFPHDDSSQWVRIDDADRFGRGGLLAMSVFLTKNSPGLRTSPVKRGYWVVRRLLGQYIPAPPPEVPDLPEDESKLGDLSLREVLASHRESKSCAGCHDRFDSIGLAFEAYGPVGEGRSRDLGGRPVDTQAIFPDGSQYDGLEGLKRYLSQTCQDQLIDNLCRKLLAYALGRSLILSDEATIAEMKERLAANEYRFGSLVETIVASPQFLRIRTRDDAANPPSAAAPPNESPLGSET